MLKSDNKAALQAAISTLERAQSDVGRTLSELRRCLAFESSVEDCFTARQKDANQHPVADFDTLSVIWNGRRCYLGRTLTFKLIERLAQRPNQYVTYERLLNDVWNAPRSNEAIRSVVRELRRKLIDAGMADLADAIDGSNRECYGLILDRPEN